jgi:hypothetical protein
VFSGTQDSTMFLESSPTNKMGRLIPLFLKATSQSQNSQSPPRWEPIPRAESPTLPPPSKSTSRPRPRPGPVTELTIVPYTAAEWLKVMEEVKTLYYKKQYRQCSARCKQILETIRDPVRDYIPPPPKSIDPSVLIRSQYRVHPLYSIYLCFFAASSLELTARTLHNNSSLKLPLLQESLAYYRKAQSHMEFAAFATNPDIIHASTHRTNSSMSSSIRSSVDSIFSETSTSSIASSILDSPTVTDFPELKRQNSASSILKPAPLRTNKKRVSFLLTSEPSLPDSQDGGMTAEDLLARFPSPPTHDTLSPTIIPQNYNALSFYNPPRSPTSPSSPSQQPPYVSQSQHNGESAARTAKALQRYKNHLDSLKAQLEYHVNSSIAQIHTLSTIRRARRSNGPDLFAVPPPYNRIWSGLQSSSTSASSNTPGHSPSSSITSAANTIPSISASPINVEVAPTVFTPTQTLGLGLTPETLQTTPLSITSRIQRLKEGNWMRPRFNAEKYQDLCERAIAELQDEGWHSSVR